jgi:hypothetical protein
MPFGPVEELQLELDRLSIHLRSLQQHMAKINVAAGSLKPCLAQILASEIDSGQCRSDEQKAV